MGLVASLIYQLYQQVSVGQKIIKDFQAQHTQTPYTIDELSWLLGEIITNISVKTTFIIIDALDEMRETESNKFLKMMQQLQGLQAQCLHIITTSRPNIDFLDGCKQSGAHIMTIEEEVIKADIGVFLQQRFAESLKLKKLSFEEKEEIQVALQEKSKGM